MAISNSPKRNFKRRKLKQNFFSATLQAEKSVVSMDARKTLTGIRNLNFQKSAICKLHE